MKTLEEHPTIIQYLKEGKVYLVETPTYYKACAFLVLHELRTTSIDYFPDVGLWVFSCFPRSD